jgi:hypothetical protein
MSAIAERPRTYSRTALETFECPHRFKEIHENGCPDTGPEALRGQGFHEAAGRYILKLAEAGEDHSLDLAKEALSEALARVPLSETLMVEVTWLFWKWAEPFRLNLDTFYGAEEKQTGGGLTWMPDLVEAMPGVLRIWDWKTYYVALTEEQAKEEFQTKFYLWRAMRQWPGFDHYRMRYAFVRLSVEVEVELTVAELEAFEERVTSILAAIERSRQTGYWPAVPGKHCRFCRLKCPIADVPVARPLRVTSKEEAEQIAAQLLVREKDVKELRDVLRGWCTESGPVNVGDMQLGLEPRTSTKFRLAEVLEVLTNHGMDYPTFDVTKSQLGGLLTAKKNAKIAADLWPHARESHSGTLRWKRRPDDLPETDDASFE